MADLIQLAGDTAANWESANPVLEEREMAVITDREGLFKIGDGVTPWNKLPTYGGKDNFVESTDENIAQMIRDGTWLSGTVYYTTED